jgi:hypothetical protein
MSSTPKAQRVTIEVGTDSITLELRPPMTGERGYFAGMRDSLYTVARELLRDWPRDGIGGGKGPGWEAAAGEEFDLDRDAGRRSSAPIAFAPSEAIRTRSSTRRSGREEKEHSNASVVSRVRGTSYRRGRLRNQGAPHPRVPGMRPRGDLR